MDSIIDTILSVQKPNPAVRIVLVRPRNPLNLLSAARAAANFGFDDVAVVAPYEPTWQEARAATSAGRWLRASRRVATLREAVEDCTRVLGTSCLSRRQIDPSRIISLDWLSADIVVERATHVPGSRIALVFGSEKRGLTNRDLELCHSIVRIPTSSELASMNLGQAVAVCCYELRRAFGERREPRQLFPETASVGEILRLVDELGRLLSGGEGVPGRHRKRIARIRQTLLRLQPSGEEVALLLGAVRDLGWRLRQRR